MQRNRVDCDSSIIHFIIPLRDTQISETRGDSVPQFSTTYSCSVATIPSSGAASWPLCGGDIVFSYKAIIVPPYKIYTEAQGEGSCR